MTKSESKINDAQEFEFFATFKEYIIHPHQFWRSKTTILLSQIQSIRPCHIEDRSEEGVEETWVYFKNNDSLAVIASYSELRKVWIKYLNQCDQNKQ